MATVLWENPNLDKLPVLGGNPFVREGDDLFLEFDEIRITADTEGFEVPPRVGRALFAVLCNHGRPIYRIPMRMSVVDSANPTKLTGFTGKAPVKCV